MNIRVMSLIMLAASAPAALADVALKGAVQMTTADGPGRFAAFELIVPAGLEEVWRSLSTSDGLAEWAGPAAFVDLRRDGHWDVYFKPDAPAGQRGSENRLPMRIWPMPTPPGSAGCTRALLTVRNASGSRPRRSGQVKAMRRSRPRCVED